MKTNIPFQITRSFLAGWDFQKLSKRIEALVAAGIESPEQYSDSTWMALPEEVKEALHQTRENQATGIFNVEMIAELRTAIAKQNHDLLSVWAAKWHCPLQAAGPFGDRAKLACNWVLSRPLSRD